MATQSYLYFFKERLYLFALLTFAWFVGYFISVSYGWRNPTLTIPGVITLVVGSIVFVFGVALYQFLSQEKTKNT